jgi:hypothetical protein
MNRKQKILKQKLLNIYEVLMEYGTFKNAKFTSYCDYILGYIVKTKDPRITIEICYCTDSGALAYMKVKDILTDALNCKKPFLSVGIYKMVHGEQERIYYTNTK